MNAFNSVVMLLCSVGAGATMLSLFIPQKRTRKMLSFVLGLFLFVSLGNGIKDLSVDLPVFTEWNPDIQVSEYDEAYEREMIRSAADRLVLSLDAILRESGIAAEDIRLSLKKSADNSISADRIVIYISDAYADRVQEIGRIVYGNLSKEPEVYVTAQEAR
jgi:hypothetical protein